ncbi:MAG TPA: LamG-like jellyroll fold domain-containing protein [Patescibacteria group bacterium]|nr:LamG-like jellyroll fold domain-containing protein [Patescibacteria group bacterium]
MSKYGSAGWKVYMNSSGYLCFGIDDDSSFDDDIICSNQNGNTTSYADSNWHHYEAVRDTSAIYLYIDGAKISEDLSLTSTLSLSSSSALFVGADSDNNEFWDGFLDEIVIYPYARSADQVKSDVLGSQLAASYGLLAADPLTEGLVGYWKMDETSDGTGAVTRVDSSGNGNSLTDNSPYAASTVGKFGNSTQFVSANSEYLSITDNASVSSGNIDFTITAWIYLDSLGTSKYIVAKWGGSNAQKEYQINVSGANLAQFSWATNASGGVGNVTANTFGTLSTSTWYFVAAYHNATTNTIGISINGGNFDTAAASGGNDGGGSLHIGATNTGSPVSFWNGRIDEVRVYSRALSAVEVQQLYDWAPGPVAYYKFDEGSGTTSVADSSGNGNTGTMNGSMTESDWVLGKFGNGLDLDGSDDYVEIGSSTKVDNSYAGTISAWIKPSGNTGYETIFGYGGGSTSGAGRFQMRLFGTSNRVILYQGSDGESPANLIYGGTSLSDNTWYYVTLSSDGSQYKIYVNGVEESLTISTGTNNGDWFADTSVIETDKSTLGRLWRDGAWLEPYRGIIDDLKIYNYARTPAQIIEDMNASHPAPGSPVGSPLLWWKFDQGTDNTCSGGANDVCNSGSSGTTLDATNNGATWSNSGKFGKALNFDTNTDDASASDQSFVDSLTGMTISLWLNPQTLTTSDDIIGKINTNQNSFRVVTDSVNSDEITVNIPTALSDLITSYSTSNLDLATGNWIHLTIVYDGTLSASSRVKVYKNAREVNGSVSGTLPAAMTSGSTSNLKLGEQDIAAGIALLSYYDEVKIYNFALTADQVKTEFNQGSATVFGSLGTTSSNSPSFSSSDSYCPPGQGTTCTAPVGEWMFDESSDGTGAVSRNDTSGNGNTLTDNNAVASSVGKHGNSAYFNATNTEFLSLTDNAFVSTGNIDFTICAWANLDTKTTNRMIVSKREGSNASKEYELHYLSSSDRFRFLLGDGTGATDGVVVSANNLGSPSTGTWYYVCGWHNAATDIIGISVNGSYIDTAATGAVAPIDTSSTFRVGSQVNTNYWDGKIDELRLYKYVRTSAQIAWDYNRGAPTAWYKFDECSGATAYNLAPAASGGAPGMNGTIYPGTGTPPQNTAVGTCGSGNNYEMWNDGTTGKRNASLGFDGNDDYADMGSNLDFSKMTSFTISTWIKTTTTGTNQQIINKWDSNNFGYLNSVFEIWLISTGKVRFYLSTNSGYDYIESSVISPDTWYQVTSWWDGTNIRLYINGNEVAYKALSGILGNTPDLIIGRISLNGTRYFNGQIDEVQIYNYALTATQIKTLYNAGAVRFGN